MSARPRCPHGEYKATLCLACVEADRDAWKARAEKAEAHIAECNQTVIWHTCCPEDARRLSQMRESDERAEMAESRATQAEAQAAAMRDVAKRLEAEVQERRAAAEEAEMSMHARIRAEYDTTVAECWRAEVAKKDARIATLEASLREMLGTHGGVHAEGCAGEGWSDDDVERCGCGALATRDRARAALKGGA